MRHVLKLIWNQRKSNIWLWAELLLVSVCLWYVVDYMYVTIRIYTAPLGYNIEHTYRIDLTERMPGSSGYVLPKDKATTSGQDLLFILERIRKYPSVDAASVSFSSQPYCGEEQNAQLYSEYTGIKAQHYYVSKDFFDVFQIQSNSGNIAELNKFFGAQSIILSSDAEKELFKGESAQGKTVAYNNKENKIKVNAISAPVRRTEFNKSNPCFYTLLSEENIAKILPEEIQSAEVSVRVKPGMDNDFPETFAKDMASKITAGNIYMLDVRPISYMREEMVQLYFNDVKVRIMLLSFLLINIFLGITGTFWLRFQQRKGEMGVRIAIGSTKSRLKLLFIGEGLILLSFAIIPAMVICFNLAYAELLGISRIDYTFLRFLVGIVATYILMAGMIIIGVWYPIRQTMKIQPAEVLYEQ
jgi:putative ABC transport system permease protein